MAYTASGWPYPEPTDPADVPYWMEALATQLEAVAALKPATPRQADGTGTFTSIGVGASSAPDNGAGLAFTAPSSGRVKVTVGGMCKAHAAGAIAYVSFEIRSGSTLRSGTTIVPTNIVQAVPNYDSSNWAGGSRVRLITGLSPGAAYNVYTTCYSAGAGAQFTQMTILVEDA